MRYTIVILIVASCLCSSLAWNARGVRNACAACISLVSGLTVSNTVQPVQAAVGEGDLPPGAIAFQKVIKSQKDWKALTDGIKPRVAEVKDKEVTALKMALKQLANEYYDMELLSKSITDPSRATSAMELAKDFRVQMRANDDAATAGDIQKIVDSYPVTAKDLSDFLDLLSDVPDEI